MRRRDGRYVGMRSTIERCEQGIVREKDETHGISGQIHISQNRGKQTAFLCRVFCVYQYPQNDRSGTCTEYTLRITVLAVPLHAKAQWTEREKSTVAICAARTECETLTTRRCTVAFQPMFYHSRFTRLTSGIDV